MKILKLALHVVSGALAILAYMSITCDTSAWSMLAGFAIYLPAGLAINYSIKD